ncbi:hypothetical protein KRX11_06400 [Pasteurellaceae bacterium TAE3-ERU1]|nr:hypothetical protein [Pasteurellaceae bacterium TAE3-ERU1]
MLKLKTLTVAICAGLAIGSASLSATAADLTAAQVKQAQSFLNTYAQIADLAYADSLKDAKKLQQAIDAFVKNPTEETLKNAKQAWLDSRESYGQSEVFRLSQGPIDAEEGWVEEKYGNKESQINAWPLDENMIDYTVDAEGKKTSGNIIDSKGEFNPGGENPSAVNVDKITPEVITELNENGGEANVASGYHAIEFLLWGQDQDYNNFIEDKVTHGAMTAGQRPLTDFTTDKFAQRRLDYLKASADKLVSDLELVYSAWTPKGEYRQALLGQLSGDKAKENIPEADALKDIFIGMGMFIKSELANERIAVAVLTPSEEDEHSCFSDNTHRDIAQNFLGFENVLLGQYNGKKIGQAPIDALNAQDKAEIEKMLKSINGRIAKIDHLAKTTMHFDYQIHPENKAEAQNIVSLKNELRRLGDKMVTVAKTYGVSLTTDDVTDSEENHDYEK